MRGRRGEGPGPCPHAPVPACANQMDTYLVPLLTIDASRHSIRHDSRLLESIQLTVTSPQIFPKHPAFAFEPALPAPDRMSAVLSILCWSHKSFQPSIHSCCRLIAHPLRIGGISPRRHHMVMVCQI